MSIRLQHLLPEYITETKAAGSEIWLKDVTFSKGGYHKIVAPSGSGKTSLMNFLYGMSPAYKGHLSILEKDMNSYDAEGLAELRKSRLSIVFQDLRLFPLQTVRQNIELKRQLAPFAEAGDIDRMAGRLGIADKLEAVCGTCSYGEKQRVAIIRSLMQPFDFILLDEPFSHLDTANAHKAMDLILEESAKRKAGIILADLEQLGFFPYTHLYHL